MDNDLDALVERLFEAIVGVREWLEQQAVAGPLTVDDPSAPEDDRRYALPPGHAEVLAVLRADVVRRLAAESGFADAEIAPVQNASSAPTACAADPGEARGRQEPGEAGWPIRNRQKGWPAGSRWTRTSSCGWNSATMAPAATAWALAVSRSSTPMSRCTCIC